MTQWMSMRMLLLGLCLVAVSEQARAQAWSIDVSAGRIVYDPVLVNVGTSQAAGTLRYDGPRETWVSGTAALPLRSGDPLWSAVGTGARLSSGAERRRLELGADVDGQAFFFRDAVVDRTGNGGVLGLVPFAGLAAGSGRIEVRGGWRGQALALAGVTSTRSVLEAGARATYGAQVRAQGEVRWVRASEGTFPFLGGSLLGSRARFQWWLQAGRWMSDALDEVTWGAGTAVAIGPATTLWGSARQDAPDPLYWNEPRRSWSLGVTRRFGRRPALLQAAPRRQAGGVAIRVAASDVPGDTLYIGGDFNQWQAVEMRRAGADWLIVLPLAPGVYNYAFRSGEREWFVPSSVASRRSDGMGGHVAVLVVE